MRSYDEARPVFRQIGILDHEGAREGPLVPGDIPEPENGYSTVPEWDDFDADAGNEYPIDPVW